MVNAKTFVNLLIPQEQKVGVCFDGKSLQKASVAISGTTCTIKSLETSSHFEESHTNISTCLPSTKTLARPFEIALTKAKDIDATFAFEAESHLPYSLEECFVDKVTLSQANGTTSLQLFAAKKSDVEAFLEQCKEHSIDPEEICPKPLALCQFVKQFYMPTGVVTVIHVDSQETTVVLVQDGLPLMARSHPVGLELLKTVTRVTANGETLINEEGLNHVHEYLRELSRILLSFQNDSCPLLFAGPIVANELLMQLFTSALERELATPPEASPSKTDSWKDLLIYSAPIGCTLAANLINFRKDEFAYPDKWRRWKKELSVYFCLMLLLSISCYLYGRAELTSQKADLVEEYATLLHVMEKPAPAEELLALSPEDIDEKLYDLENELKQSSDEMALHPDVPRVSDLVAWLSSHPNVVLAGDDPKALLLENLTYTMVKRPEKGKLKEHYQVRVDLEFSAPTPTMAREFHDALLTPNAFVDPKNELKWNVQKGHFKASFFLKDRTKYPQQPQVNSQ